jgi:YHS domain-containing protein
MGKFKEVCIAMCVVLCINTASAQNAIRLKHFNHKNGLALQGFDPVAYFTLNLAKMGQKQYAASAEGITYYFSSAENRALFLKDYKRYEPQYGGWCAYAMGATNEKVEIDPETFKVKDGKLFLFYHTWLNNTFPKWNSDEINLKANADKNWIQIFK